MLLVVIGDWQLGSYVEVTVVVWSGVEWFGSMGLPLVKVGDP